MQHVSPVFMKYVLNYIMAAIASTNGNAGRITEHKLS